MAKAEEGTFQSADHQLYRVHWLPDSSPKAIILLVHGIGEHSRRYDHVAELLVKQGYAVYALDHRGHGRSEGTRVHFDSFDVPVNDLRHYFDLIQAEQPDKPIFVYGHSMGSLISLLFTLRYQSEITGLIISGTTLALETLSPAVIIKAGAFLQKFFPKLKAIPPVSAQYLTHDEAIVRQYRDDPLIYSSNVRLRMAYLLIASSREVHHRLSEITLPLLILHGAEDKICPPQGATILYEGVSSTDKTLKIYPGLYHEIHNEPEYESVIGDVIHWLDAH